MRKATIAAWLKIDGQRVVDGVLDAGQKLDQTQGEMVLDFSAVARIDPGSLRELEKLASLADNKAIKVGLRGVNIDIYKVLKLMKLVPRFSFLS